MRLLTRQIPSVLPGVRGTLRVGRPTRALIRRLRESDIAVIDHLDLDRATALAIRDAGVVAVVNAQSMVSGRYPNRGPEVLAEAGLPIVDNIGDDAFSRLVDGRRARLLDGEIFDGEQLLAQGRPVDIEVVRSEMNAARTGLASHLDLFTHNSTELLRREEGVFLHGAGVPPLDTPIAGRPVLVVADHPDLDRRLCDLSGFIREQRPVVVAVGTAAGKIGRRRMRGGVLVLGGDPSSYPDQRTMQAARDVVLAPGGGSGEAAAQALERAGVVPRTFASSLAPEDAALLVAYTQSPSLIVGAGLSTTLTDYLEDGRPGLAGTFLSRLALGPTLVDASAVPLVRRSTSPTRRWSIPVAAAIAALAIGVGVGARVLPGHDGSQQAPQADPAAKAPSQAEIAAQRFVSDNGTQLVAGALKGRRVALLTLPGADKATVTALRKDLTAAGAQTTATLEAQSDLLDPARKQYVDTLATELAKQLAGRPTKVAPGVVTYQRIGQVIGATYLGRTSAKTFDQGAETAAVALLSGRLVRAQGRPSGPADLVLVVLGEHQDRTALTGLVQGLGATSDGVVVAGETKSKDLGVIREQHWPGWLASVDGVDSSTGQVTATLALRAAATQQGGSYGASGFGGLLQR